MKSIRARLTLWYTSLLTVTLVLLGGTAYALLSYSLSHEVDAALNGVARSLTERAHGPSAFVPAEVDEAFRRFFGFSPWNRYFQLFDPLGHRDPRQPAPHSGRLPLSGEALNNAANGISTYETVPGSEEHPVRVLTMPVMEGGRMVNLVQVGMSLKSVLETRTRFLLIMAVLFPVGLVLAATGGLLLARRALRPVDRMAEAARRISAEHLAERIGGTGAGDELDRLASTLNEMLGRLDTAFTQVRRFSADASHELQTPLTILKGELEVALRSPRTPEEYQAVLKSALEEIDRIAHLVEGLLLLARAEAGVLRMDRRPVDLEQLAEEVYWRLKVLADSRSIRFDSELGEPVVVPGDRERLRRLLFNLVDNAIKYTRPGGVVRLSVRSANGTAVVDVSDSGPGIAAEDLEKIFLPFQRVPMTAPGTERGAGLGLSIARSIATAHGGRIQVRSVPGKGSTFSAYIPMSPEAPS